MIISFLFTIKQAILLLEEKINSSFLLASSLSKSTEIKNFLQNKNTKLHLNTIIENLDSKSEYTNLWIDIVSKDGISLRKSWSKTNGENSLINNKNFQFILKDRKPSASVIANEYGLFVSNAMPLYNKDEFVGFLLVHIQLDTLLAKFEKRGYQSVALLNKENSANIIQNISYSKQFLDHIYIINKHADSYLVKLIKQKGVETHFLNHWHNNFIVENASGYIVSKLILKDIEGIEIANVFIFKHIDDIELSNIRIIQEAHIATTSLIILLIVFLLYVIYTLSKQRKINKENRLLILENDKLLSKTNEMDFQGVFINLCQPSSNS